MRSRRALFFALLGAAACGTAGGSAPAPKQCETTYDAVVVASDYGSSGVGALSLDGGTTMGFGVDLGIDPALAESRGRMFFVARDADAIFELDPKCGTPIARFSVHALAHKRAANPQDVAVAPDGALWVPLFDEPAVAIVAPGGVTALDLASLDADGNPQASAIVITELEGKAKAFVALEMLDGDLKSRRLSKIARFDVSTRALEGAFDLPARNPFGAMREAGGPLWLASPGNFDALDEDAAGVARFDPSTGASRLVAREKELGGSVVEVAVSGRCGAAIVAGATSKNATSLAMFDAESGAVLVSAEQSPLRTADFDLRSLAWIGDTLLVGDRRRAGAGYPVHAFSRSGACDLTPKDASLLVSQKPIGLRARD